MMEASLKNQERGYFFSHRNKTFVYFSPIHLIQPLDSRILFTLYIFFIPLCVPAQTVKQDSFSFSAFAELYFAMDQPSFNKAKERADFLYNHKQVGQPAINLLLLHGQYDRKQFRAKLGLMAGSYPKYNLANEPPVLRYIYEASLGIKLLKGKNLWLDMGILPSHIGFESVLSQECNTLTRSLVAENSPYYESGLRLSYTASKKPWYAAILILNGWQRITIDPKQKTPSIGLQIKHELNKELSINYSNFMGKAQADSIGALRFYHNLYINYNPKPKVSFWAGFDIGSDWSAKTQSRGNWYTPVIIGQYKSNKKWALAARTEYFSDTKQIIMPHPYPEKLGIWGYSVNVDYKLFDNILLRCETKMYHANIAYFATKQNQWCGTASICCWL